MAVEILTLCDSLTMNVSSTAKQYYIVKHTTTAETVTLTTAAGERSLGVVQDQSSSGGIAKIALLGITKLAHDGTLTPGAVFQCSSAGLGTAASTEAGIYRLGTCIKAGSTVSGTLVTALLIPGLAQSTN